MDFVLLDPATGCQLFRCLHCKPQQPAESHEGFRACLEAQGDLVSRLIMGITRVTIGFIGVINLLTKSP